MNCMTREQEEMLYQLKKLADGDSDLVWTAIISSHKDDSIFSDLKDVCDFIKREVIRRRRGSITKLENTMLFKMMTPENQGKMMSYVIRARGDISKVFRILEESTCQQDIEDKLKMS